LEIYPLEVGGLNLKMDCFDIRWNFSWMLFLFFKNIEIISKLKEKLFWENGVSSFLTSNNCEVKWHLPSQFSSGLSLLIQNNSIISAWLIKWFNVIKVLKFIA